MAGFLSKLFGKKKSESDEILEDTLQNLIDKAQLKLSFDVQSNKEGLYKVDFFGEDEELLTEKEGQLLDSFQLFVTRVLQHQLPEDKINVEMDCNGFREEANKELITLAEKLKGIAVSKKKSVYFRALPPKERKIVHQYLADDDRVKSRSIGDGLYKKIKIYPAQGGGRGRRSEQRAPQN